MELSLIVAMARDYSIGVNGSLLWNLPKDMNFFKKVTMDSTVIMGRKTYLSIPEKFRPLSNRDSIVISASSFGSNTSFFDSVPKYIKKNTTQKHIKTYTFDSKTHLSICSSIEVALSVLKNNKKTFVIGGASIYREFLDIDIISELYITHVDAIFPKSDTSFPNIDFSTFKKEHILHVDKDEKHMYAFDIARYSK